VEHLFLPNPCQFPLLSNGGTCLSDQSKVSCCVKVRGDGMTGDLTENVVPNNRKQPICASKYLLCCDHIPRMLAKRQYSGLEKTATGRSSSIGRISMPRGQRKRLHAALSQAIICAASPTTPVSTTNYATMSVPDACLCAAFSNHTAPTPMRIGWPSIFESGFRFVRFGSELFSLL